MASRTTRATPEQKKATATTPSRQERGPTPADLNPDDYDEPDAPSGKSALPRGYLADWSQRHARADVVNRDIRNLAFPEIEHESTFHETTVGEDPAAIGSSVISNLALHGQRLPEANVLRKWEVPDLPPSHKEGFGSSVRTNVAAGNISPESDHLHRWTEALSQRMSPGGHEDPLGDVVSSRRGSMARAAETGDPDASWYQGKAQALIHDMATRTGVPTPVARKTTATESPRMKWDLQYVNTAANRKLGRAGQTVYPNIEAAGDIIEESKGRGPEEAAAAVVERGVAGVQRQMAARVASRMMSGELLPHHPIPVKGDAEKVGSFDVALSEPTHPKWGYSPTVERHQLSSHTGDVQDARAGGYHEEQLEVPRATRMMKNRTIMGTEIPDLDKKGKAQFVGKAFHERMLSHPAGADIAQSTALIARTEDFTHQRAVKGEEWAKQNAKNYMAAPQQSVQWSAERKEGNIAVPAHIEEAYANRRIGLGSQFKNPRGSSMRKTDWKGI